MRSPVSQRLRLPAGYGTPKTTLEWESVRGRLAEAAHYWLVTVRPDGRPHAMPVDGLWIDDTCCFGGSVETIKHRNLAADPRATIHLEDATSAVIVEGVCAWEYPDEGLARRLAKETKRKYGFAPSPDSYAEQGLWRLRPDRVLAWQRFPHDATRFVFPERE